MGDQIGGINAFRQNYRTTRDKLVKDGNSKPTTKQIIDAMKNNNQGKQNDSVSSYFDHFRPQTKYMPPVPPDNTAQTRYMPPVPPKPDEPQTKYMPPVSTKPDEPQTKYMPPVPPKPPEPQTKYMPPVPPKPPEPQTKYMPPVKE